MEDTDITESEFLLFLDSVDVVVGIGVGGE